MNQQEFNTSEFNNQFSTYEEFQAFHREVTEGEFEREGDYEEERERRAQLSEERDYFQHKEDLLRFRNQEEHENAEDDFHSAMPDVDDVEEAFFNKGLKKGKKLKHTGLRDHVVQVTRSSKSQERRKVKVAKQQAVIILRDGAVVLVKAVNALYPLSRLNQDLSRNGWNPNDYPMVKLISQLVISDVVTWDQIKDSKNLAKVFFDTLNTGDGSKGFRKWWDCLQYFNRCLGDIRRNPVTYGGEQEIKSMFATMRARRKSNLAEDIKLINYQIGRAHV